MLQLPNILCLAHRLYSEDIHTLLVEVLVQHLVVDYLFLLGQKDVKCSLNCHITSFKTINSWRLG